MKNFISLLICIIYILSSNVCFAFNELYTLKNTTPYTVSQNLNSVLLKTDYAIQKTNPYYLISTKDSTSYAILSLKPFGSDVLCYFEANKDKKLSKFIFNNLNALGIPHSKYINDTALNKMAEMTHQALSGQKKTYSFDDIPQKNYQAPVATNTNNVMSNPNSLKGYVARVGKGMSLGVYLQNPINTATAAVGDQIIAVLKDDWVINNSYTVASQGSILYGTLTKANHAQIGLRNGSVQIDFNRIDTPDGKSYDITAQKVDFEVTDDGRLKSTITNVAVSAATGAALGLLFALLGSSGNYGSAAAIGAGMGGGVALITQAMQAGVDAEIPSYTELEIILDSDINVVMY